MSMTTRPMGNNVVPFDTTTPAPTPPPWPPGPWPFPPTMLPGCAPPGAMDNLMGCYWSVQQATAFISAIMIDAINNNPAVTQAIIAAIEKSGSNLPTIGVTDGSNAQPGQVGEFITSNENFQYTAYPNVSTFTFQQLVLAPGDWDIWAFMYMSTQFGGANFELSPIPAGMSHGMGGAIAVGSPSASTQTYNTVQCPVARGSFTAPTLMAFAVTVDQREASTLTAGQAGFFVHARRVR